MTMHLFLAKAGLDFHADQASFAVAEVEASAPHDLLQVNDAHDFVEDDFVGNLPQSPQAESEDLTEQKDQTDVAEAAIEEAKPEVFAAEHATVAPEPVQVQISSSKPESAQVAPVNVNVSVKINTLPASSPVPSSVPAVAPASPVRVAQFPASQIAGVEYRPVNYQTAAPVCAPVPVRQPTPMCVPIPVCTPLPACVPLHVCAPAAPAMPMISAQSCAPLPTFPARAFTMARAETFQANYQAPLAVAGFVPQYPVENRQQSFNYYNPQASPSQSVRAPQDPFASFIQEEIAKIFGPSRRRSLKHRSRKSFLSFDDSDVDLLELKKRRSRRSRRSSRSSRRRSYRSRRSISSHSAHERRASRRASYKPSEESYGSDYDYEKNVKMLIVE